MAFFSDLQAALDALRGLIGEDVVAVDVPTAIRALADDEVVGVIAQATALVRGAESVRIAASGAAAARSTREAGHRGLAQKRGHRSAVSLIQDLTGTTRAEAAKQVRLGEALDHTAASVVETGTDAAPPVDRPDSVSGRPWHAVLGDALLTGRLTSAQHDAIYRGLGEPPAERAPATDAVASGGVAAETEAAWQAAATQLVDEAAVRTVEELASASRTIRDLLDPEGAARRFDQRHEARAFRTWTDREGTRRASFTFDDEGGAWVDTIIAAALRPRRGGPRFVDPDERAHADDLVSDPRTNDQLAYDLMLDVIRAGALAEPEAVFGTRQAGIRIVTTAASHRNALQERPSVTILEDDGTALPGWLAATHTCDTGTVHAIHDDSGNPLALGRETRLFTPKQRIALALRDGGCRIPDCDRPASYCEAHHIDEWALHHGRTDVDRGILLCRFHHMSVHHHGGRITRDGNADFILHRPGRPPTPLTARLTHRYAFGDLKPPPRRFRSAA